MMESWDLETALGAVVPDEENIGRINAGSNEHIEILMHDVIQLFHHNTLTMTLIQ